MATYVLTTSNDQLLAAVNRDFMPEGQSCSANVDCKIGLGTQSPDQLQSFTDYFFNVPAPENATVGGADFVTLYNYAAGEGAYVFVVSNSCLSQLTTAGFPLGNQVKTVPIENTDQTRLIIEPEFLKVERYTVLQKWLYDWVHTQLAADPQDKELKNLYEFLGGRDRSNAVEMARREEHAVLSGVEGHQAELQQQALALYEATVNSVSTKEDVYTVMLELHGVQEQIVAEIIGIGDKTISGGARFVLSDLVWKWLRVQFATEFTALVSTNKPELMTTLGLNVDDPIGVVDGVFYDEYMGNGFEGVLPWSQAEYDIARVLWDESHPHAVTKADMDYGDLELSACGAAQLFDAAEHPVLGTAMLGASAACLAGGAYIAFGTPPGWVADAVVVVGGALVLVGGGFSVVALGQGAYSRFKANEDGSDPFVDAALADRTLGVGTAGGLLTLLGGKGLFRFAKARGVSWSSVRALPGRIFPAKPAPTPPPPPPPSEPTPTPPPAEPLPRPAPARLRLADATPEPEPPLPPAEPQPAAPDPVVPPGELLEQLLMTDATLEPEPVGRPASAAYEEAVTLMGEEGTGPTLGARQHQPLRPLGDTTMERAGLRPGSTPALPAPSPARAPAAPKAPRPAPQPKGPGFLGKIAELIRAFKDRKVRPAPLDPPGWNQPSAGPHPEGLGLTPGTGVEVLTELKRWVRVEFTAQNPQNPNVVQILSGTVRGIVAASDVRVLLRRPPPDLQPGQIVEFSKTVNGSDAVEFYLWKVTEITSDGAYMQRFTGDASGITVATKLPYQAGWR